MPSPKWFLTFVAWVGILILDVYQYFSRLSVAVTFVQIADVSRSSKKQLVSAERMLWWFRSWLETCFWIEVWAITMKLPCWNVVVWSHFYAAGHYLKHANLQVEANHFKLAISLINSFYKDRRNYRLSVLTLAYSSSSRDLIKVKLNACHE